MRIGTFAKRWMGRTDRMYIDWLHNWISQHPERPLEEWVTTPLNIGKEEVHCSKIDEMNTIYFYERKKLLARGRNVTFVYE